MHEHTDFGAAESGCHSLDNLREVASVLWHLTSPRVVRLPKDTTSRVPLNCILGGETVKFDRQLSTFWGRLLPPS
jgi:hypothetical protein